MPTHDRNSWEGRDLASVFHGFSDIDALESRGPMVLTHGDGAYVFDVHGNRFLDANSGLWNSVAGFNHPGLTETMIEQTRRFASYHALFGRVSDVAVALSERLIDVSPFSAGKVFYTNSGSEANDTVVKMLWLLHRRQGQPQRRKIVTRINAYHGVTAVAASMTGKAYNAEFGLPLPGFAHAACPHYWRYGLDGETEAAFTARMAANLEEVILAEGADTIAGFFAEPVMGAGGVIPPPQGYFAAIQPVLRKYGVPLIADEVICGFGRTGEMWGSDAYGARPDVIVASKCITAGFFPMGAIILSEDFARQLMEACAAIGEFPHGFTAAGHPVGCAVALKAIDVIADEGLLENVRAVGPYFQERMRALGALDLIGEVRGVGLMAALEVVAEPGSKQPFPESLAVGERIARRALDHGLICRPIGDAIVLAPPFIISERQVDDIAEALRTVIGDVSREIAAERPEI